MLADRIRPQIEDVNVEGLFHQVGEEASFHPEKGDSGLVKAIYITEGENPDQTHQTVCVTVSEKGRTACAICEQPPFCKWGKV